MSITRVSHNGEIGQNSTVFGTGGEDRLLDGFTEADIGAAAAKAHFVPHLTSSSEPQRTAQFSEAATRV